MEIIKIRYPTLNRQSYVSLGNINEFLHNNEDYRKRTRRTNITEGGKKSQ